MNNEKSNESNKLATVVISGNSLQVHDRQAPFQDHQGVKQRVLWKQEPP